MRIISNFLSSLHLSFVFILQMMPSSSQRPKVNTYFLVTTEHANRWIEATLCYSNFPLAYRLAISCEENLHRNIPRLQSE